MHAGDPLAQWSYVCPSHPEGLEATHVIRSSLELQTEVVWTWFNANFEPFNENGPWFRLDDPDWGFGKGQLAPEHRTASDILAEEFQGVVANPVVGEVARLLAARSRFWTLVERPPEPEPASPQAVVRAALARLMTAAASDTTDSPGGMGHNQGPPFGELPVTDYIARGVAQIEAGLSKVSTEGGKDVQTGKSLLATITGHAGKELWSGYLRGLGAAGAAATIAGAVYYKPQYGSDPVLKVMKRVGVCGLGERRDEA